MRASNFIELVQTSLSVDKEFNILSNSFEKDHYSLGVCRKKFKKYSENNLKKAYKYIEDNNCGINGQVDYIDLGVVSYNTEIIKKKTPNNKSIEKIRIVLIKKYIFFGWSAF
ncbi:MAG: hypothetical protein ACRC68_14535 [Clostridium sp.]